jgi:hypothetical protein
MIRDAGKISLSMLNANINEYIKYTVTKDGKDVSVFYKVEFDVFEDMNRDEYIPIEITRRAVTLTAGSATKEYDGEALTNDNVELTFGTLAEGHTLYAKAGGSITEVGIKFNPISEYYIIDSNGVYVTDNYEFTFIEGELTVLEKD